MFRDILVVYSLFMTCFFIKCSDVCSIIQFEQWQQILLQDIKYIQCKFCSIHLTNHYKAIDKNVVLIILNTTEVMTVLPCCTWHRFWDVLKVNGVSIYVFSNLFQNKFFPWKMNLPPYLFYMLCTCDDQWLLNNSTIGSQIPDEKYHQSWQES